MINPETYGLVFATVSLRTMLLPFSIKLAAFSLVCESTIQLIEFIIGLNPRYAVACYICEGAGVVGKCIVNSGRTLLVVRTNVPIVDHHQIMTNITAAFSKNQW